MYPNVHIRTSDEGPVGHKAHSRAQMAVEEEFVGLLLCFYFWSSAHDQQHRDDVAQGRGNWSTSMVEVEGESLANSGGPDFTWLIWNHFPPLSILSPQLHQVCYELPTSSLPWKRPYSHGSPDRCFTCTTNMMHQEAMNLISCGVAQLWETKTWSLWVVSLASISTRTTVELQVTFRLLWCDSAEKSSFPGMNRSPRLHKDCNRCVALQDIAREYLLNKQASDNLKVSNPSGKSRKTSDSGFESPGAIYVEKLAWKSHGPNGWMSLRSVPGQIHEGQHSPACCAKDSDLTWSSSSIEPVLSWDSFSHIPKLWNGKAAAQTCWKHVDSLIWKNSNLIWCVFWVQVWSFLAGFASLAANTTSPCVALQRHLQSEPGLKTQSNGNP